MKEIKVLGTGCANCRNTIALIETIAKEKGIEITLEKVDQLQDIMGYGVMSTPGVVIDGKVVRTSQTYLYPREGPYFGPWGYPYPYYRHPFFPPHPFFPYW